MHTVVGAGATSGSMDASNLLKPALARGQLRCIGATTIDEYRQVSDVILVTNIEYVIWDLSYFSSSHDRTSRKTRHWKGVFNKYILVNRLRRIPWVYCVGWSQSTKFIMELESEMKHYWLLPNLAAGIYQTASFPTKQLVSDWILIGTIRFVCCDYITKQSCLSICRFGRRSMRQTKESTNIQTRRVGWDRSSCNPARNGETIIEFWPV